VYWVRNYILNMECEKGVGREREERWRGVGDAYI
jgi:hypothetical protein